MLNLVMAVVRQLEEHEPRRRESVKHASTFHAKREDTPPWTWSSATKGEFYWL